MTIERTELANREYLDKTVAKLNEDGIDMSQLGAAFFRVSHEGHHDDIHAVKRYMWSKQTWRLS